MRDNMESEAGLDSYEGSRVQSRESHPRTRDGSPLKTHREKREDKSPPKNDKESALKSRSKAKRWHSDPDRDRVSDGEERRSDSSYSSDDEKHSLSRRSLSSSSSRSPSPTGSPIPQTHNRAKRISGIPLSKPGVGVGRWATSHPFRAGGLPVTHPHRRGIQLMSKLSVPSKDPDLVTKRLLSARLLKINELSNALSELQRSMEKQKKENRLLRQLQARQEKALQRYDDTESEISLLLSRHAAEIHVLRERLRQTQERERTTDLQLRKTEELLQRSRATVTRLKKLVDQEELGARDELNRKLEEEKTKVLEGQLRIRELERNTELINGSYQRQLIAEKKKTTSALEQVHTLKDDLERLTAKLKEKEKELESMNIYSNRMAKPPSRKENDRQKGQSRSFVKSNQADDKIPSLEFPTPPPAMCDVTYSHNQTPEEYISLKVGEREERAQNGEEQRNTEKGRTGKKDEEVEVQRKPQLNGVEEKSRRSSNGLEREEEERRKKPKEEESYWRPHPAQEEVARWSMESMSNQQLAEEALRKKELLLAKLRELEQENPKSQNSLLEDSVFTPRKSEQLSPHSPRQKNSIFGDSEDKDSLFLGLKEVGRRRPGLEGGPVATEKGRRNSQNQTSTDELAFGDYAPSFGHSISRAAMGFPPPPPLEQERSSALEAIGVVSLKSTEMERDLEKKMAQLKKSDLMQQLFGSSVETIGAPPKKPELVGSPLPPNSVQHSRRERQVSRTPGSPNHRGSPVNSIHVAESRPAIRALASLDDDIEELTL